MTVSDSGVPRPIFPGATEFEVELARTGVVLTVPAHRSLLSVIREVLPDVPTFCEAGMCGTCATSVLEGEPDHHDAVLSAQDRAANDVMMICMGRSKSARLVLDL